MKKFYSLLVVTVALLCGGCGQESERFKATKIEAKQGDAEAQSNLGWMYSHGDGVPQDYVEAVKWYRKAAVQGDASGQNRLGDMYFLGKGVPQDYVEAMKWYRKAAVHGDEFAQHFLGTRYAKGKEGVPKDEVEAYAWFLLAKANSDSDSLLWTAFDDHIDLEEILTVEQKKKGKARAAELRWLHPRAVR